MKGVIMSEELIAYYAGVRAKAMAENREEQADFDAERD
jgi:hypothetical protein